MTQKVLSDQVTSWRPSEDSRLDSRLEFELILREHQAYVTRLAHRLLGWSGDVEDVVQDVFVAVMEHRSRFCGRSSLRTWITSITVNRCRQYRRRQRLLSKWFSRAQRQTRLSCNDNPDDILDEQEQTARLQQAMATLPIRYRDVLVLRYLEELSVEEVGNILKLSANSVNVLLHRARQRLRKILERNKP